eukprot:TRINITY_DN11677_c0_g1_i1.p1 TRINITY_DN11677_c0_g1~~TRINITY_DN11677_c0_g1_i1.p1  ORF type:complete len:481 (+),score=153.37 TRINITY_DN11677_c0_g1_i1:138-1580(+)
MKPKAFSVLAFVLLFLDATGHPIKHIVVLMMENHSFDNLLGWLPGVGDLTGAEYNLANASDPTSKRYYAGKGSDYCTFPDPDHSFPGTQFEIFAPNAPPVDDNGTETMGGFAERYLQLHEPGTAVPDPQLVMNAFTPDQLPIISTLAQEFLTCTNYYASIPGATNPNRMFVHTGTSKGITETLAPFPILHARSFYEDLMAHDPPLSWEFHYQDFAEGHFIEPMNTFDNNYFFDPGLDMFFESVANNSLANYTFLVPLLSPNFDLLPTSQHPVWDIRGGETLVKSIYEKLRASPHWNDTLFVLIYDEHGGFFDKMPPPKGVPNPCPTCQGDPYAFDFDRLGLRLPAVFVSPWLPELVDATQYDHTSVIATARRIFGLSSPPLTSREAAANHFADKFLATPRTDAPMTLPEVPSDPPMCVPGPTLLSGLVQEAIEMYDQLLVRRNVDIGRRAADSRSDWEAGEFLRAAIGALFPNHRKNSRV